MSEATNSVALDASSNWFAAGLSLVLLGSLVVETAVLADLVPIPDGLYHGQHLLLMALVIGFVARLRLQQSSRSTVRLAASLTLTGLISTGIGDWFNSALSGLEPVSAKLSWALLTFGIGYTAYVVNLGMAVRDATDRKPARATVLILSTVIFIHNLANWWFVVQPVLPQGSVLYWGSLLFNQTLYVAMPLLAFLYAWQRRWDVLSILILGGAVLLPWSDLVLFASWLPDDPPFVSRSLYAINWLVYFGGQVLMALLPYSLISARGGANSRS